MEDKRKHLEFIQAVITRMAGNLFFLRGWAITLITGLFALSATRGTNNYYILLAYFLLVIFWILDGYFLSQERKYRCLYDDVRQRDEKEIDFSMSTKAYEGPWRNSWVGSVLSPTLLWFYVPLALAMSLVLYLVNF